MRFTCWILAYANVFVRKVAQRCSPCTTESSEYQHLVRNCSDFRRPSLFPEEIYTTVKQFFPSLITVLLHAKWTTWELSTVLSCPLVLFCCPHIPVFREGDCSVFCIIQDKIPVCRAGHPNWEPVLYFRLHSLCYHRSHIKTTTFCEILETENPFFGLFLLWFCILILANVSFHIVNHFFPKARVIFLAIFHPFSMFPSGWLGTWNL